MNSRKNKSCNVIISVATVSFSPDARPPQNFYRQPLGTVRLYVVLDPLPSAGKAASTDEACKAHPAVKDTGVERASIRLGGLAPLSIARGSGMER